MIKVDSRKVEKGDTFLALRGISSDGHDYIDKAIEAGAIKVIAEEGNYSVETVIVKDTREYLSNYLYEKYKDMLHEMKIIGITGTNGKTTTAYLIYQALNKLNIKCSYIGTVGFYMDTKVRSLNNTTPDLLDLYELFIESFNNGCKYVVLEASSQGLAYKRLDKIEFDYALFTNLTQDHLDYHKTMENYALAKQQLFKQLKKDGKAIINYDDKSKDYFILEDNKNIFYGFTGGDLVIKDYNLNLNGTTIKYTYNNKDYEIKSGLIGKYNIYNMILMLTTLLQLNINIDKINKIIPTLKSPKGRMELLKYNDNLIIIDYAHTPDAFENIIGTINQISHNNTYIAFGCTGDRDRTKRNIMTNYALENCKYAILTIDDLHNESPNQIIDDMLNKVTYKNYEIILDRQKAIEKGIDLLENNDIFLILGKGHEEFIIVKDKKIPFNDYKCAKEYVSEKLTEKESSF